MKKPNILFFLADQHRYDCTGYAGRYPVSTPNIDRVGREGAAFDFAFTPTPVCAPARQSFLSGRRAEAIGAMHNYNFYETKTLMPDDFHFTGALEKAGYRNILIGAWDASVRPPEEFGIHETRTLTEYSEFIKEKYNKPVYKNGWLGERNPIPLPDSRTHWCADRCCEALESCASSEQPFFIWVDGVDPHLPCRPSEPFYGMYDPETVPMWDGFGDTFENKPYIQKQQIYNWRLENMTWRDFAPAVACYYSMISQVDNAFGRILDRLDSLGLSENTLVIYTSDHGDMCGSHGMLDKHYILYDDVIHVPLVMRLPSEFEGGKRIEDFVCNCLDLAPTLGELCGFDCPDTVKGHSLVPLLKGEPDTRDDYAVCAQNGQQFGAFTQRCIRTRTHKYVWNMTDTDELYDLTADPGELKNLIADPQYSKLIAKLRRQMRAELVRCGDPYAKTGWVSRQLNDSEKLTR